jgi:DNA adenine methylase
MNAPIRWYGGKSRISQWICEVMSRYRFTTYVEPFGGSGAVLFAKEPSPLEVYNDIYGDLVNMYEVIRDPRTYRQFKRFVSLTPYSRKVFEHSQDALKLDNLTAIERAAHFFIVCRQNFGGMNRDEKQGWSYVKRTQQQRGHCQSVAYVNTIDRLDKIHQRLRRVQIESIDVIDCIRRYAHNYGSDCSIIYCDPPYLFETRSPGRMYQHEFENIQHERLLDVLLHSPGHKILSAYESDFYAPLLAAGWTLERKETKITCSRYSNFEGREQRRNRVECLYCSPLKQ